MTMTAQIEHAHHQGRAAYRGGVPFEQLPADENVQWGYKDEQRRLGFFIDGAVPPTKPTREAGATAHDALSKALAAMDAAAFNKPRAAPKPKAETWAHSDVIHAQARINGPYSAEERAKLLEAEYFGLPEIIGGNAVLHQLVMTKLRLRYETHRKMHPALDGTDEKSQTLLRLLHGEKILFDTYWMAEQIGEAIREDANFGGVR